MDDISFSGFIAMLHYIYTNTFDTSASPLDMTELIRSTFVWLQFNITFPYTQY